MTSGSKTRIRTGLHIVRKQRTSKPARFYVYAYRGGPCIHTSDGARPTISQDILDRAAEARRDMRTARSSNLNSLIEAYQRSPEWDRLGDRTKKDYRSDLSKIAAKFGTVPLAVWNDQRMRADVMEWRATLAATPRTADRAIVMLATVLSWSVMEGKLHRNVAAGIPMLYSSNRADIIWTDSDWKWIKPHCADHVWKALRLASLTGLRLGDLIDVRWDHVGLQSIVYVTAKRKRRIVIPILPDLRALLADIGSNNGTILKNSRGQPWTESGFESVFQKAKTKAKEAKGSGFNAALRIHDFRGTYATWLARNGLTDQEIGRIVGWSEKRVAEIRRRYIDEEHVVASLVARLSPSKRRRKQAQL